MSDLADPDPLDDRDQVLPRDAPTSPSSMLARPSPERAQKKLLDALRPQPQSRRANGRLVVAFSGGSDSTALLWGLRKLSPLGGRNLVAAHLDHGLDSGSRERAELAADLAASMDVELVAQRSEVHSHQSAGESTEAAARRVRYEFLERTRRQHRAAWIATAHHLDDQLETIVLRLLRGTGLRGLAGIRARHGKVIRPVLGLRRDLLCQALAGTTLVPIRDPTNFDLGPLRNQVRRRLPRLVDQDPSIPGKAGKLARSALIAADIVDRRLETFLDLDTSSVGTDPPQGGQGPHLSLTRLDSLSAELRPFALALLHRRSGAVYPPRRSSTRELYRQLERRSMSRPVRPRLRCDAGGGWCWHAVGDRLFVSREAARSVAFPYTLQILGEL